MLLKITRQNDRIKANLTVHNRLMIDYRVAGYLKTQASKFAMIDLENIPMTDRIAEANLDTNDQGSVCS